MATIGFHYVSPWAALAIWLLYIFIQGAFSDWYPYPFLGVTDIGLGTAIRNALLLLVIGLGLAAGFKALDARLPALPSSTPSDTLPR